ncbi:filamentous hemagglutinin N-terminal domain-containing protein [Capilliphycus salinus ALCB114379]|uniref:two-partner secretion domain-containing protein n=1 Tax=Capilliphycus salinus TaxID=2768948 RepID=UPI0039A72900
MQVSLNPLGLKLFLAVVSVFLFPISASSQPITPASDGTGTRVNTEGNRHDIEGGSLSQDGRNLFHSFEKFGLSEGEIANFLSNPDIRNILGRVVGGDASIIHGLIQVTGGNSNLFLMNPAGIVFGSSASLNVPADFTATTATGIQFNENWFNAVGNNDYQALVGTPSGYAFAVSQPGVILNEGNLILEPGSHLTLLAGTVINTGQLSSPGGQITLASVEGENLVRISQEGQLLNLEISPMETASGEYPITPLSLPQLLTGGETTTEANTVIVSDNGQIILQNSNTVIPDETGTVIVSGNLDVSDTEQGGNINIFSRNLLIIESEINTNGENISGNLLINSDNDITINQLLAETEAVEITAEQDINFNQMTTEGSLTATTTRGNINRIDDNSLITAPTALFKTGETGSIGRIENPLLLDVENIEAVAGSGGIFLKTNSPLTVGNVSEEFTGFSTTGGGEINLNVEGDLTILENISTAVYDTNAGNITLSSNNGEINTTGLLDSSSSTGNGGNVSLTAEGNITTNNISSYSLGTGTGGNITLSSNNGEINTTGLLDSSSSTGNGGNVSLTAESNITTNNISSYSGTTGTGGNITLSSNNGEINTTGGWLDSFSSTEDTGNVSLTAERNIITGDITSGGGEISLESSNGDIDTKKGRLDSFSSKENTENISSSSRNAGNVSLTAEGNITTGNISSFSEAGRGGNITLESVRGEINTTGGSATQSQVSPGGSFEEIKDTFASDIANLDSYSTSGSGGNITLEAQGNITTYDISSWGGQNSGNVNITTRQGNINTAVIFSVQGIDTEVVSSVSETSRGGQIRLDSPQGNITTSHLLSSATQQGGEITINSGGRFSLGTATINSFASEGEAGNVTINANDGVTLGGDANRNSIRSDGLRRGGNIEITSSAGEINIPGELNSFSSEGEAGNVTIDANNSVTLGNNDTSVYAIRSYGSQQGGNIEITSSVGEINIGGKLDSYSEQGRAGNVTLNAGRTD